MMTNMFVITSVALAMDKKEMPKTSLSAKEVAELRQAVVDYKKGRSQAKQEGIIQKYQNKYPNDPFVKSKVNEKAKFAGTAQSQVKKEQAAEKKVKTSLSSKEQAELRAAVEGIKNKPVREFGKELSTIYEYVNKYYQGSKNDDPFVKAQVDEALRISKLKKQSEYDQMMKKEKPNLRITNRESYKIEVDVQYMSRSGLDQFEYGQKTINPQETILMFVPEADQRSIYISVPGGYSDISGELIKKGQILDVVYEDDHKFYPMLRDRFSSDPDPYPSKKSFPHLHKK